MGKLKIFLINIGSTIVVSFLFLFVLEPELFPLSFLVRFFIFPSIFGLIIPLLFFYLKKIKLLGALTIWILTSIIMISLIIIFFTLDPFLLMYS
ncbi:hypothetical protein A3D07_03695 [Candidatus Curtissbacteria bacterium RIFCSPHIGHO2_02_FULL_42_15]|uniref:DUF1616 domain-containing protein n=1 Tax=Candidatus Curtissbacteria bacterium RIFCSPHIGHO2_02_FULL_42_15 TaxID=1797716 RepID=A0A1F5GCZ1_9BACT|nr:MAG: hypothetical protein A3D07_03695 [Candidatus Curtissbacteria bacterium RIFCSPHIGHO2_02_FULL_42_15]